MKAKKILVGLSALALLAGCRGPEVSEEEASKRMDNIAAYRQEHAEELSKQSVIYTLSASRKDTENDTSIKAKYEVGLDVENNVAYIKGSSSGKNSGSSVDTKLELYLGVVDGSTVLANAIDKTYIKIPVAVSASALAKYDTAGAMGMIGEYTNVTTLLAEFRPTSTNEQASEEEQNGAEVSLKYYSSGEGAIAFEYKMTAKDDEGSGRQVISYQVSDYQFSSVEYEEYGKYKNDDGKTVEVDFDLSISARYNKAIKMPDISKYESKLF